MEGCSLGSGHFGLRSEEACLPLSRLGGGLNTLHESRKMHLELGCWGQMQWPTCGRVGYITHAVPGGVPTLQTGGQISSDPRMVGLAT